jgi:hypothetical protein
LHALLVFLELTILDSFQEKMCLINLLSNYRQYKGA